MKHSFARSLLAALPFMAVSGSVLLADRAATAKPNVIFILADDLGWRDLGCYGSSFHETPGLDRLAASGVRFTEAYAASSVCSPSRASILTGKYPARLGITDWLPGRTNRPDQKLISPELNDHLNLSEFTLGEAFKASGYATAFIGKWHLGGVNYLPENQGFDLSIAADHRGAPPSYFSPYRIPSLPDGPAGEYLTDRLTEEALQFIEQEKGQPFFLFLSHYAVHNPQQAKPELVAKYKAKLAHLPPSAGPEMKPEGNTLNRQIQNQPVYAALLESLDQSVGRIMDRLESLGLDRNTIIVFTSDNGGLSTAEGRPTSNLPLRAGKGWNYEGGIREPLIIRGPQVAEPGRTSDQVVTGTDFYPTLLEMAGLPSRPEQHLDGISVANSLTSAQQTQTRTIFWHYPHYSNQGGRPAGAIRSGNFKLVEWFEDGRAELFDLKKDSGEAHDLSAKEPGLKTDLLAQLHHWREQVDARMPTPNPAYGH